MPCYPALALLLGSAIVKRDAPLRWGTKALAIILSLATVTIVTILWFVRALAAPGDISQALNQNPALYTLSLGHMADLTLRAFAYLRLPLALAACAFAVGAAGAWLREIPIRSLTIMMVVFIQAARLALTVFDPYLSSRRIAEALLRQPAGELIAGDQYYTFSSIFFYTNRKGLLLNGRVNNLEYGSYAPGAPVGVFINNADLARLWRKPGRYFLVAEGPSVPRLEQIVGKGTLREIMRSGGKFLFTNR